MGIFLRNLSPVSTRQTKNEYLLRNVYLVSTPQTKMSVFCEICLFVVPHQTKNENFLRNLSLGSIPQTKMRIFFENEYFLKKMSIPRNLEGSDYGFRVWRVPHNL